MKKLLLVLLVLVNIMFLSACNTDKTIKIGYSNNLSASAGELGIDGMYGAQLAVKEINDNGGINGKQLELIVMDDTGDSDTAVEIDNELKAQGCVAIIGHGLSSVAEATIQNANLNDILLISPTITSTAYNDLDDNFLRVIPSVDQQGIKLANTMYETHLGETIILYEDRNSAFSIPLYEAFSTQSNIYGVPVLEEHIHSFTGNSFSEYERMSEIINNSMINNVLIIGSSYDTSSIVQKLEREVNLYVSLWSTTSDLIGLSGNNIEGTHIINFFDIYNTSEKYLGFTETFTERFGVEPSFSSMLSYEAVYILAEALETADDYSASSLKQEILDIKEFDGIMDTITFDQFGDIDRKVYSFVIHNGEYVVIDDENN